MVRRGTERGDLTRDQIDLSFIPVRGGLLNDHIGPVGVGASLRHDGIRQVLRCAPTDTACCARAGIARPMASAERNTTSASGARAGRVPRSLHRRHRRPRFASKRPGARPSPTATGRTGLGGRSRERATGRTDLRHWARYAAPASRLSRGLRRVGRRIVGNHRS